MNTLEPPYVIKVVNTADLVPELKEMLRDFSSAIAETRAVGLRALVRMLQFGSKSKISLRPLVRCGLEADLSLFERSISLR